jgi:hypothetical protein
MVDQRKRLLLAEIELQCGFALKAYGNAADALGRRDSETFWYSLQALLGAAARIRELLEPDEELRRGLDVPDGSPLLEPELDAPNAFPEWLSSHPRGPLRLSNFGPLGVSQADPAVFVRFIDVEKSIFILFGNAFDIPSLLAAIAGVNEKAKA